MQGTDRQPGPPYNGGVEGRGARVIAASRGRSLVDGGELTGNKTPSPLGDDRQIDADIAKSIKDRANLPEVRQDQRPPHTGAVIGDVNS